MDLNEIRKIAGIVVDEAAPSAGMTKGEKSEVVKAAKKGEDIGDKGKNFKKIADKAAEKYGSKEAGEKVAAAVMWKKEAKEGIEYSEDEISAIVEAYDDEDDMTPAEKELAKMGTGLSKSAEKKIDKADKKAEEKAAKSTAKELDDDERAEKAKKEAEEKAKKEAEEKAKKEAEDSKEVEESLAMYRQIAGVASPDIVIEGEQDADVYLVITECFTERVPVKDIQVFKDAVCAKAFVAKMKGAVKSATIVGKKFSQVKAK